ncbi:MAG: carbonic anhydrase family protein, partial [Rhodospirillales bacterium]|nr:carbonic anhydrase family protein [Rhodospirillales bacterium]
ELYKLVQFHFHHPSEHLLSGKRFKMEAHFVHKAEDGRLAVLGVFIRPGAENAAYAPIFANMPEHEGPEKLIEGVKVNPADMLPAGRGYFRYMGSLTTPPCSEGILWSVFKDSLEASPAQIEKFAKLFPMNARPPQELNRRFLLDTRT